MHMTSCCCLVECAGSCTGLTMHMESCRDYSLGEAVQTTIIEPGAITEGATPDVAAQIKTVQASASITGGGRGWHLELIGDPELLSSDQKQQLLEYMDIHHIAFTGQSRMKHAVSWT